MLEPAIAADLVRGTQRIVVTGASGWLGLATLELLASALGGDFAHRVVCFGSVERDLHLNNGLRMRQAPLRQIADLPLQPTWLLHFAFLTKDHAERMDDAAYCAANRAIGVAVLEALDRIGAEAVFLASSGAASRTNDPAASQAMRLYGTLKQADEDMFTAWGECAGRRVVIGRIYALTGPYINKPEAYAIASFILDGLARRPIVVRAPRRVVRAYVAIREVMSLAFALLGAERSGVARFDTGGMPLELAEAAAVVAAAVPGGTVERAAITDVTPDCYYGNCDAYDALLAVHRVTPVPLPQQVAETIDYLGTKQ